MILYLLPWQGEVAEELRKKRHGAGEQVALHFQPGCRDSKILETNNAKVRLKGLLGHLEANGVKYIVP